MKTTTTITLDAGVKRLVMPIIQNEMQTSLSAFVEKSLREILEKREVIKNAD